MEVMVKVLTTYSQFFLNNRVETKGVLRAFEIQTLIFYVFAV